MVDGNDLQAEKANGFSLHAAVVCEANERKKPERLCCCTAALLSELIFTLLMLDWLF